MNRTRSIFLGAAFSATALASAALAQPASERAPASAPSARPSAAPTETAPPTPYARLRFREIGPAVGGGRVTSVVGSARNPSLYYLGAAAGGVWKSANGGATWTPVFDKQTVGSIGAIALDPTNDDTVWVGTGETNPRNDVTFGNGIYKSTDAGKTWTHLGLADTLAISSIVVDPRDPKVAVVGAMGDFFGDSEARGVYRTADGGATWTKSLYVGPRSGVGDMVADPKNPEVLFAGVWEFRRQPWTFQSGGQDDGLYKSTDGGKSWSKLSGNGLPDPPIGRIGLAIAPSNPKRIYALIESGKGILWRSDDGGATWTLASSDTLADQRPFYFTHIRVDPHDENHVYAVSEMLAESKDGGKTFKETAEDVHVDYHAMWIAPNDSKRMIVGEDGGYALTLDGGKNWSFSRNLAIGQVYHVGYDDGTPYRVCAPLQDNNGFCGPSNALNPDGIPNMVWERVIGGDGVWAWPDPVNPNFVWSDLQQGRLVVYDRASKRTTFVSPYNALSTEDFDLGSARYRFNWNSPIAFSPWEPGTVWFGGDAVFQTRDRGRHWTTISPDLTLNDKSHQRAAGGPITLDVSSAEYTDTILDIEGSTLRRGEIWVGTDDGLVQLTRDGGKHWRRVPPHVAPNGRFEIVAPSTLVAGTAYTVYDRHEVGDRAPYVYVTHDWGATWTPIANGLPTDQPARSIRADTRNPHLVYVGLERSMWASWDDGATWRALQMNLPPAPVYDLRVQPRWNDLIVATHGRSLWILDSLASIQGLAQAQTVGAMVFAPRPAYEFSLHSDEEEIYTRFAGQNPPNGAIVDFYQGAKGSAPPAIEVLDAGGHVIRHIKGTRKVNEREIPLVSNDAGINRVVWDLRADGPIRWMGAAREEYRGPRVGVLVLPGKYTVRVSLAARTYAEPLEVRDDPRSHLTNAESEAAHAFYVHEYAQFSAIDAMLNRLDSVIASAEHEQVEAGKRSDDAIGHTMQQTIDRARAVRGELTADYHNDEDSIQRPGKVREELEIFTGRFLTGPPSPALREYARRVDAAFESAMRDADGFFAKDVAAADAALKAAGRGPLADVPNPPEPSPSPAPTEE